MKAKKIPGVPEQVEGAFHDTESEKYFEKTDFVTQEFEFVKDRFFSINNWKDYCGKWSADFKLYDSSGHFINRMPQEADFVRIDIPGPGDIKANGYDWVQIVKIDHELIDDDLERHLIVCRPSKIPGSKSSHIAHFYSEKSMSIFIISRGKNFIKIGVYGRNEIPNFSKTGIWGRIRNFIIWIGGFLRLTKMQWKSLTDGLLEF